MAGNAIVSEEFAKKFVTERETPYSRWVRSEGLEIIGAHYVPKPFSQRELLARVELILNDLNKTSRG